MNDDVFYVTGIALSKMVFVAEAMGLPGRQLMKEVGIEENQLKLTARVPEHLYELLILRLIRASDHDSLGIEMGKTFIPPVYGVLMNLALSSSSLGEALKNMFTYDSLASGNCGGFQVKQDLNGMDIQISMTHQNPAVRRHIGELVTTFVCHFARVITLQPTLAPSKVYFEHAPASDHAKLQAEELLACPIEWGHDYSGLFLDKALLEINIHGHCEQALSNAKTIASKQLAELENGDSSVENIKWHTRELMLNSSPRRELVAERLQLSTRTLDRRLKEAGLSWQELLDELRTQLALEHLANADMTVADIAQRLGFQEKRSFQRRFKVWTGVTPSDYRKTLFGEAGLH